MSKVNLVVAPALPTIIQPPATQGPGIAAYGRQQLGPFSVGLLVGILLGFFSHWLTTRRDDHNRIRKVKDEFLVRISQISGAIDVKDIAAYYRTTKNEIRNEVFKVKPFLNARKASKLVRLWEEYDAIVPEQRLIQKNEDPWIYELLSKRIDNAPPPPQKPSAVLKEFFGSFSVLAK